MEKQLDTPEANAPLNITVSSEASEVMMWRTLARQAVPMLTRPEQFHISQRKQLAQTICLLLDGDLEREHVFGEIGDALEPGYGDIIETGANDIDDAGKERWRKERWGCE